MSLHKPVPRLRLATAHYRDLPSNPLRAGLVVLQWIFWHPQALAAYSRQWQKLKWHRRLSIVAATFCYVLVIVVLLCLPGFVVSSSSEVLFKIAAAILLCVISGAVVVCYLFESRHNRRAHVLLLGVLYTLLFAVFLTSLVAFGNNSFRRPWPAPLLAFELALLLGIDFSVVLAYDSLKCQPSATSLIAYIALVGATIGGAMTLLGLNAVADLVPYLVTNFIFAAIGCVAGFFRVDDWLWATLNSRRVSMRSPYALDPTPWVTPLPISRINEIMRDWLDYDWRGGVANVWEMWHHTRQQRAMTDLIWDRLNDSLAAGRLAESVAAIADYDGTECDWRLFYRSDPLKWYWTYLQGWRQSEMASAPKGANGDSSGQPEKKASLSKRQRQRRRYQNWMRALDYPLAAPRLPMETAQESTVAGFFYLAHCYLEEALLAFRKAPQSQAGIQEMCLLSETLLKIWDIDELGSAPTLEIANEIQELEKPNRKPTWDTLAKLDRAIQMAWLYRQCQADKSRQWCQKQRNQHLGQLAENLPRTERTFVTRLAKEWSDIMDSWENAPPPRKPMKRFANPFNFEEPIRRISEKRRLVGRERELDLFKQLWELDDVRTVVVSGQCLSGKTSLVSIASSEAGANIRLTWLKPGTLQPFYAPVKQFLYTLCQAVERTTATPVIASEDPAWDRDPYIVCQEYLQNASRFLNKQTLWVVVDEFERLQRLFANHGQLDECLRFVADLQKSIGHPGFVFITRPLPERYRNSATSPLANASRQIQCSYLGQGQTLEARRALMDRFLNARLHEHGPRFRDEAVDAMVALTNGHPYLTVLLAHFVLKRFFDQLGDAGHDPIFDDSDVYAVLNQEQVRRGVDCYCHEILTDLQQSMGTSGFARAKSLLKLIAQNNGGTAVPTLEWLAINNGIVNDSAELQSLLREPRNLDIIEKCQVAGADGYRIYVELFRRWILTH